MKGFVGFLLNKGWQLVLIATGLVLVFGAPSAMSLGQHGMAALGDGTYVVTKSLPTFFTHVKNGGGADPSSTPTADGKASPKPEKK